MAIKVKELKADALIDIKVNKSYYLMVKGLSYYLFTQIKEQDKDKYVKETLQKDYAEMDDLQKAFYTVSLLLAEIERQSITANMFEEKEVLQPGDEGYVEPSK
jgi:hypothetical protein